MSYVTQWAQDLNVICNPVGTGFQNISNVYQRGVITLPPKMLSSDWLISSPYKPYFCSLPQQGSITLAGCRANLLLKHTPRQSCVI